MSPRIRRRFWVESGLATLSGFLLALTLTWHDWIERSFRVGPDGGSGSLEWLMVATLLVMLVGSTTVACQAWRGARGGDRAE